MRLLLAPRTVTINWTNYGLVWLLGILLTKGSVILEDLGMVEDRSTSGFEARRLMPLLLILPDSES